MQVERNHSDTWNPWGNRGFTDPKTFLKTRVDRDYWKIMVYHDPKATATTAGRSPFPMLEKCQSASLNPVIKFSRTRTFCDSGQTCS